MLKFKNHFFEIIPIKHLSPKTPILHSLILGLTALLGLSCLLSFFYSPTSLLILKERSELIPTSEDLLAPLMIQQSYTYQANPLSILPYWSYFIGISLGLFCIFIAFKRQSTLSWPIILAGIFLWMGIQVAQLPVFELTETWILFMNQLSWIALLGLFFVTILSSNAILEVFIQIAQGSTRKVTFKRLGLLAIFWAFNLYFSLDHLLWKGDFDWYLPSFMINVVGISLYLFQQIKRSDSIPFLPIGLTFMGLSSLLFFQWTANDPAFRAFEIWNLICQLTMLGLFPLFVLTNFKPLLQQNLAIYKVIHKPIHLSLYLIHVGVFILGLASIFAMNGSVYHLAFAGKYNMDGDMYSLGGDQFMAEIAYKKALQHSKLNAKSNLSLAKLAIAEENNEVLAYYLKTSQTKYPSKESSIALSELYRKSNLFFESLFELQSAYQQIGPNAALASQIAYSFVQLNQADSAQYYYQKAFELDPTSAFHKANYALNLQNNKIPSVEVTQEDLALKANLLALAMRNKKNVAIEPLLADFKPHIDLRDLALLFNSVAYFKHKQAALPIEAWAKDSTMHEFFPEIDYVQSLQDYYHQKPLRALEKMALLMEQANEPTKKGISEIIESWHQATTSNQANINLSSAKQAREALIKYPFSLPILQKSMVLLPKKEAYDAALIALRWNPSQAAYYSIYAFQALELGELDYAKEAMNSLQKLEPSYFSSKIKPFEMALKKAEARQKF